MIERALAAGAAGYLNKSSVAAQMVDAVHTVAKGESLHPHTAVTAQTGADKDSPLQALTKREFQVFSKLAEGQAVTDIAEMLSISPKTVGVHQTNIMNKLALRNTAELTRLAIRTGVIEP
jgi:two-component system invasion response regulator UvrY